jgi:hypothetical protein
LLLAAPPPFISDDWVARFPSHDWRFVPGSNHYTVLFDDDGAATIATALLKAVSSRA